MPLVRYHINNEYKLANPKLYTSVAKDDPQGVLEGVSIAGLVGIVRQLGDLAVFASEVFQDLHEEVLASATRSHELLSRVQHLEAELPSIEKLIFSHPSHVIFAYNPGVKWRANIQNGHNYFTHQDLPRFMQKYYEKCRSPPKFFLLDKFDAAGTGACLKRYSDPSLFKIEWARMEIKKAEKEQKDKKNQRIQRKTGQKGNYEVQDGSLSLERMSRNTTEAVNLASLNAHPPIADPGVGEQDAVTVTTKSNIQKAHPFKESVIAKEEGSALESNPYGSRFGRFNASVPGKDLQSNAPSFKSSQFVSTSSSFGSGRVDTTDLAACISNQPESKHPNLNMKKMMEDDGASETDNFMDAMTTIESEIENDSELRSMARAHGEELRLSKRTNVQSSEFNRLFPPSDIEENSLEESISESSERSDPRSSEFVFRPIVRSHNAELDTDEDTNGIQAFSPSSSTSSSALSSPRPSTLATTLFNMNQRSRPQYQSFGQRLDSSLIHSSRSSSPDIALSLNQGSYKEYSGLESFPLSRSDVSKTEHQLSPKRSGRLSLQSSGSLSPDISLCPNRGCYKAESGAARAMNHGAFIEEMEGFPPPPPLPPLEWLMSRRVYGKFVPSPKAMDSSPTAVIPTDTSVRSEGVLKLSPTSGGQIGTLTNPELCRDPRQQVYMAHMHFDDHKQGLQLADAGTLASHKSPEVFYGQTDEPSMERTSVVQTNRPDVSFSGISMPEGADQLFSSSKTKAIDIVPMGGCDVADNALSSPVNKEGSSSLKAGSMDSGKSILQKHDIENTPVLPKITSATFQPTSGNSRDTLKKLSERSQSSRISTSDDRESMLEQIRTGSFSLRHAKTEKQDHFRSIATNINVAAILEKANAIRQAIRPNDDDGHDAWSDA